MPTHAKEITEAELRNLYPKIASHWKKVGLYLGQRWRELAQFEHCSTHDEVVFQMLLNWSRHTDPRGKRVRLTDALKSASEMVDEKNPNIPWESGDICDDKYMFQICEHLGRNWEKVAGILNISKAIIDKYRSRYNPVNINYTAMDVFVEWRESQNTDYFATFQRLVKAMQKVSNINFVKKIKKNARSNPKLLITLEHFTFCKDDHGDEIVLGEGTYGRVTKAIYMAEEVAVKIFAQGYKLAMDKQKKLEKEARSMREVSNTNTVPFKGILLDDENMVYGLVMDYMPNGSLHDFFEVQKKPVVWPLKSRFLIDVARGMTFLHKQEIVHQDLKSTNVLIDDYFNARIGDFGHASFCDGTSPSETQRNKGTPTYAAPEIFDTSEGDNKPQKASDVWSYGILMFFIAAEKTRDRNEKEDPFKRLPFPIGTKEFDIMKAVAFRKQSPITRKQEDEKIADDCPQFYREQMRQCTSCSMEERPKFSDILKYLKRYFDNNKWEKEANEETDIYRRKRYSRIAISGLYTYTDVETKITHDDAYEELPIQVKPEFTYSEVGEFSAAPKELNDSEIYMVMADSKIMPRDTEESNLAKSTPKVNLTPVYENFGAVAPEHDYVNIGSLCLQESADSAPGAVNSHRPQPKPRQSIKKPVCTEALPANLQDELKAKLSSVKRK